VRCGRRLVGTEIEQPVVPVNDFHRPFTWRILAVAGLNLTQSLFPDGFKGFNGPVEGSIRLPARPSGTVKSAGFIYDPQGAAIFFDHQFQPS
jgi:hypothetical protein